MVIVDIVKYIADADLQLSNNTNYKNLQNGPTSHHNIFVNDAIDHFKKDKLLLEKTGNGSTTTNPTTPKFINHQRYTNSVIQVPVLLAQKIATHQTFYSMWITISTQL